jgi:hypothetical protein
LRIEVVDGGRIESRLGDRQGHVQHLVRIGGVRIQTCAKRQRDSETARKSCEATERLGTHDRQAII